MTNQTLVDETETTAMSISSSSDPLSPAMEISAMSEEDMQAEIEVLITRHPPMHAVSHGAGAILFFDTIPACTALGVGMCHRNAYTWTFSAFQPTVSPVIHNVALATVVASHLVDFNRLGVFLDPRTENQLMNSVFQLLLRAERVLRRVSSYLSFDFSL